MSTKTHYIDGDNYQLRQIIFANTPKAIQQCKSIAPKFKGATEMDTCRNIFDFLKNDIKYVADGSHQKVKLPSALLRERVGIANPFHCSPVRYYQIWAFLGNTFWYPTGKTPPPPIST